MGGQFEVKDGATKKYYSIAGMMVAMNDGTGLQYLLTDHLGSTVAVTNQSGTLTSQQRYLPFGAARTIPNSPILGTDFTYTGQRKLDDGMGGIMDYKARFYSPYLNRFFQPDTMIPDQSNPQSWNRFSYVANSPLRFSDPTGHMQWEETYTKNDGKCGAGDTSCNWVGKKKDVTDPDPLDDVVKPEDCDINCDLGIVPQQQITGEHMGWVNSILANEWTPLIADLVQLVASVGIAAILIGVGVTTMGTGLAVLAVVLGLISTTSMIVGMASLDYQADNELHGVSRSDFGISVFTNLAAPFVGGVIPEAAAIKLGKELPKTQQYFYDLILPFVSVFIDLRQE